MTIRKTIYPGTSINGYSVTVTGESLYMPFEGCVQAEMTLTGEYSALHDLIDLFDKPLAPCTWCGQWKARRLPCAKCGAPDEL